MCLLFLWKKITEFLANPIHGVIELKGFPTQFYFLSWWWSVGEAHSWAGSFMVCISVRRKVGRAVCNLVVFQALH